MMMRNFIDSGADIIHGHHSHIPQGFEKYKSGYIFYGLGNFFIDYDKWCNNQNNTWSLVPHLSFDDGNISNELFFSTQSSVENLAIKPFDRIDNEYYSQYLQNCNDPLFDKLLLTSLWQEVSVRMYNGWYKNWLHLQMDDNPSWKNISGSIIRKFLRKNQGKSNFTQDQLLLPYVLFACESHRNAIATALGVLSGELDDLRTDQTKKIADFMIPWSKEDEKNDR